MAKPVKTPNGRREQKARATRLRILEAAETLFVHDGFAATTINAIADAADVAVQTVYAVFSTKRAILTELLALRVVGDDEGTPLQDRSEWQAMEQEPDPRRQLDLLASIATRIGARMSSLYGVMASAADADAEIAQIYRRQQDARYHDQRRVARSLARKHALKPGLSQRRATDIMWAIANPNTYRALVGERQWPVDEYERWLGHMLASALLPNQHG